MKLLRKYLSSEAKDLIKNDICLKVIGQRNRLPADIVKNIIKFENLTKKNQSLYLTFALDYGSRQEITLAVKNIIHGIEPKNSISISVKYQAFPPQSEYQL